MKLHQRPKKYVIEYFLSRFKNGGFVGTPEPSIITTGSLMLRHDRIIIFYNEKNVNNKIFRKYIPKIKEFKITESEFKHIISQVWQPMPTATNN